MDYRWKDIFITIVPGATLIGFLYIMVYFGGCDKCTPAVVRFLEPLSLSSATTISSFPLLALYAGYMVNLIASLIERKTHVKDRSIEEKEERHRKMVEIGESQIVEEYFVHYAMARNMLFVHIINMLISLFCCCPCGCDNAVLITVPALIISIFVLYKSYIRYLIRYKEIINEVHNSRQHKNDKQ